MSDKLSIPLSIIVAGLLIGGGIYLGKARSPQTPQSLAAQTIAESKNIRPVSQDDYLIGNPAARVVIVEYSDTECAFCKEFHKTMNGIMKEYGAKGEVAWVYRHLPIKELHSRAPKEAEGLECAGELGGNAKFWEYTNRIYDITPSDNGLNPAELVNIAKQVGLESGAFTACLESGKYSSKVDKDISEAMNSGASGTPYSVMIDTKTGETYPIAGAQPYSTIKEIVDLLLQS